MLRYICVLSLCSWFAADALGVTVTINYLKRPTCTYSDGRLRATATGGVGPYTYLWNTGATTETITDVPAGAYSVTVTDFNSEEATANYNLVSLNYDLDEIFLGSFLGRCGEVDHLVLDTWYIPGPPPYFIDGQQVLEDPNGFYHPYIPSTSDTTYTFTFEDGNGCTGIIEDRVGWPYEFPEVTVLEVSGSCANDSSGQVVLDVSSEGHEQDILSFLYGNDNYWCGTQIHSIVRPCYDLPPGEYYLATTGPAVGPLFASRGCADTTWFTIPDLGPTCGSIHGRTHIDQVRDCENDWTEPGVSDQLLEILPGPYYTLSRAFDGSYGLQLPFGDYTVQQLGTVYEPYCQPDPIPFALMQGVPWAIQNFADTSTLVQGVEVDLQVMMACGAARPGFELEYAIHRKNLGPGASGTQVLTMTFDPTLGFLDATPAPTSIVGNTLTWNTGSMWGGSEAVTRIHFQVPPDIELLGTVLEGTATLATAQPDVDLTNNTVLHSVVITGAYDPNDKRARTSTGTSDSSYYVGDDDHIDYTIRFQNTGTDTAFHVVISDTIATNLDLRTFVAGASSYPYELSIRNGNTLRFAFYNILLPDSNVNEPASHGFVSFRIKPREPIVPGSTFVNIANIHFDFNPPVITEPSVLVAEFSTGIREVLTSDVRVFPNPNTGLFTIVSNGQMLERIELHGVDGRLIRTMPMQGERMSFDMTDLATGHYLLRLFNSDVTSTLPIIKM